MATLYLHIGTPKTGTTSIQSFCRKNRRALRRKGYSYRRAPFFYENVASERNAHFLIAQPRNPDGSFASAYGERAWRKGMRFIADQFKRCPNVILTEESIWHDRTSRYGLWRDLRAEADARGYDVRIIVYLRRQDQFLASDWAQKIIEPYDACATMKWEEILACAEDWIPLDYCAKLDEIAEHFGRDAINARVYDRKRFPNGDIVLDFLEILGLSMDGDFTPVRDRNHTVYGNALEIKRIVNSIPDLTPKMQRAALKAARACCALERGVRPSMFSLEECREFLGKYEESNRRLAREYFGEEADSPFPEPAELGPKWERGNPDMYETIVRFFAIEAFARPKDRFTRRARRLLRRIRGWVWRLRERVSRRLFG